jgi:hypothetical protein
MTRLARSKAELPSGDSFRQFSLVELDERGMFVERSADAADDVLHEPVTREVSVNRLPSFLREYINLPSGVTDVFVWVHGWRHDYEEAVGSAARLFHGINVVWKRQRMRYPNISTFVPGFVAVHWPSMSSPFAQGYSTIRDRAHAMTEGGTANFLLGSLLGYLEAERRALPRTEALGTLKSAAGYYVHCVGHSFGGRFLGQAIAAAADPLPRSFGVISAAETLSISSQTGMFGFTVDSLLVFQMAAPSEIFSDRFRVLLGRAPLSGPICLSYSPHDRATCVWHKQIEGRPGIGCTGATAPPGRITTTELLPTSEDYDEAVFLSQPLVNINCGWAFTRRRPAVTGAHSDFWYDESIHLLLSMVNAVRVQRSKPGVSE